MVVISASGEKDAVWEVELAKKSGLKTVLITCSPDSSAAKMADQVFAYKKLPEPYTYNTSTYLGMILSATSEKAENIKTGASTAASTLRLIAPVFMMPQGTESGHKTPYPIVP